MLSPAMHVMLACVHCQTAQAAGGDGEFFVDDACAAGENLRLFEANNIPVVVGEWSLATVRNPLTCPAVLLGTTLTFFL